MLKKSLFTIILSLALLLGCTTNPITGRRQLALVPSSQLNAMAFQQYSQFLSQNNVVRNTNESNIVQRVGVRMQKAVEQYMQMIGHADRLEGFKWEFNLVEDPAVNAWCMPGGKVVFYTGILPICKDEAGVAVVMGHEIAHAVANHGGERMSHGLAVQLGGAAMQVALSQKPQLTQALFAQSFGIGSQLGMLKFSRTHESEADEMGLYFMAIAGYDPTNAPAFWQRMSAQSQGQAPPEFLSTHPSHDTRINDLNSHMPQAVSLYRKYGR